MGRRALKMSIQLSYPQTNSDEYPDTHGKYVNLRLEDEESGLVVADIDLSAQQWMLAQSTAFVHVQAQVPVDLTRVGKRREVQTEKLGYVAPEDAERVADAHRAAGHWDVVTTGSRQGGRYVELVRWVDIEGQE